MIRSLQTTLPLSTRPTSSRLSSGLSAALLFCTLGWTQGEVRYALTGASIADDYGTIVNNVGDLDGDGFDDFIVGAPSDDTAGTNAGAVRVYSGRTGAVLRMITGTVPNQHFGLGAASAGDVDGDGVPDLIVGLPKSGSTGMGPGGGAKVFSGATGALIYTFAGTIQYDGFGTTVAAIGDINGDGRSDFIIGTAMTPATYQPGYANVYSGATGQVIYALTGYAGFSRFGSSVSGAGDVNGDGVPDFMVAAIGTSVNGSSCGATYVYSGATGQLLLSVFGDGSYHKLGYSIAPLGDINGDGHADFVVGTYRPTAMNYARVYSGANGAILHQFNGDVVGDVLGHAVGGAGDVNGDGIPDVVVGAPLANHNGMTQCGMARVYSGANGAALRTFYGEFPGHQLGYCVAGGGDVNKDGFTDVLLGSSVLSGSPGRTNVVSLMAGQTLGVQAIGNQTLSLSWLHGDAGTRHTGLVRTLGAAAGSPGILAAALAPGSTQAYGVTILLDPNPETALLFPFTFSNEGSLDVSLDLRSPIIAELTLYAQVFELSAAAPEGVFASNGLALLFGR